MPVVFIGPTISLDVPVPVTHVASISYGVPPARFVFETVHLGLIVEVCDQKAGNVEASKYWQYGNVIPVGFGIVVKLQIVPVVVLTPSLSSTRQ